MAGDPPLLCLTCNQNFFAPAERLGEIRAGLIEEESSRCARLRQVSEQRQALATARSQAGFAGIPTDSTDRVIQRDSMARLEQTLNDEAESLKRSMWHSPAWK